MSDKAIITTKILKWARDTAHMSLETAAAKVPVDPRRLLEWEKGENYPTMHQAEMLAKAYRRPFALFFLPDIPYDFQPLQDFRANSAGPLHTASLFIIREMQQKQAWISSVLKENNETPLSFIGKFTVSDNPAMVAADIVKTIGLHPGQYSKENIMNEWVRKSEELGIFISRASFVHSRLLLDTEELQGFAIADPYGPFIFINSKDWNAPQLFTLLHELAHLWIAASGISNDIGLESPRRSNTHPLELFCNEVAANALIPNEYLKRIPAETFSNAKTVFAASQKLGVSSFSFLLRAKKAGLIGEHKYSALKKEADAGFREYQEKEAARKAALKLKQKDKKSGGPNANLLLTYKNGQLFTRVVIDAYRGGQLLPTEASSLLNTAVNNFTKLEAFV